MERAFKIKASSTIHGYGVFACRAIQPGELLWVQNERHHYLPEELKELPPELIERSVMWGNLRYLYYLNHSCEPNTAWSIDGALIAKCEIASNQEITYDYSSAEVGYEWVSDWTCGCGSLKCRVKISSKDILRPELYARYQGALPSWVEEYVRRATSAS